jgi:hypothetical protein
VSSVPRNVRVYLRRLTARDDKAFDRSRNAAHGPNRLSVPATARTCIFVQAAPPVFSG